MDVSDFARNLSFFSARDGRGVQRDRSRGAAHLVGRDGAAVRADARSQMLKYHIQTRRSLHAQEIEFNDIRTVAGAAGGSSTTRSRCNTNAYDEAITTPRKSVRRAMAIQLIITANLGWRPARTRSRAALSWRSADLVEEAVLAEFDRNQRARRRARRDGAPIPARLDPDDSRSMSASAQRRASAHRSEYVLPRVDRNEAECSAPKRFADAYELWCKKSLHRAPRRLPPRHADTSDAALQAFRRPR